MRRFSFGTTVLGLGLGMASTWCVAAASADDTSTASSDDTGKLEEIVVTAERRTTDVEKTALVIDTVSGSELAEQAKNDMNEVLRTVPGVEIQGGPFSGAVYIRGIGPTLTTDPSVNVAVDDVYQTDGFINAIYDVNRVEVLKGPQGTLYGRNSTAGAVNLITNNPTDTFGTGASVEVGNYSLVRTEAELNVPLFTGLDFRTAFFDAQHSGYMSNGGADEDDVGARAKLLWRPVDEVSLLLIGDYAHVGGTGNSEEPISHTSEQFLYWIANNEMKDLPNPPNPCWCTTVPAGRQDSRKYGVSARLDVNFGFANLTYIPAWYQFFERFDGAGPVPGALLATDDNNTQMTQELRLASADQGPQALKWLVGFYYIHYQSDNTGPFARSLAPDGTDPTTGTVYSHAPPSAQNEYDPVTQTKSWAPFAQVTVPIIPSFRITAGVRYTHDSKYETAEWTDANNAVLPNSVVGNPTLTSTATTWKGGLEFDAASNSLLYADASTGYKAGGFNAVTSNQNPGLPIGPTNAVSAWSPITYKPEYITALEVGSKNRFFDDRVQLNADVYHYQYRNFQEFTITFPLPGGSQPPQPLAFNAGRSHALGAELEGLWAITPNDRVNLSVDYDHTRFDSFLYPSVLYGNQNRSGSPYILAPQWQENFGLEHIFKFTNGSNLSASFEVRFSSSYLTTVEPNPDVLQPAFHKSDARLSYTSSNGKWTVTAFGDNLENIATRQFVFGFIPGPLPPSEGLYQTQLAPPRTYGLQLSTKY